MKNTFKLLKEKGIDLPKGLFDYVVNKTKTELSPKVIYHGLDHYLYVTEKAIIIGEYEGAPKSELRLLATAALLHDIGYIKSPTGKDHEKIGAEMAEEILRKFKYPEQDIAKIKQLILATQVTKEPQNKLEEIMRDADVYMLGDEELVERWTKKRARETNLNIKQLLEQEINFLKSHKFFTNYGKIILEPKKQENMRELQKLKEE